MLPSEQYVASLLAAAEHAHGRPISMGTTVVVDPEREGSGSASCYPTPQGSIVWCDAQVLDRLSSIDTSRPLSAAEFVEAATALGAWVRGFGHIRVLDGDLLLPDAQHDGLMIRHVGIDEVPPVGLLGDLGAVCDDDDVDAADLDLDHLDPTYTLLVTPEGAIAACASARPAELDPSFDDIAVLTHPSWRGRRLGAFAVHEFCERRRAEGRPQLYRCNVENIASNRLANTLGFTLVATIGAVSFEANASLS